MAKRQKDAVVEAVISVLGDSFVGGTTIVKDIITPEQKSEIKELVFNGIVSGEIGYGKDLEDTKEIKRYANGVVDNHVRRAKELNAGTVYKPSKEGTKRDPQLKELNKLLNSGQFPEDGEQYAAIVSHIETRTNQLASERAAKRSGSPAPVDADMLPAHLQNLVSNTSPEETTGTEA